MPDTETRTVRLFWAALLITLLLKAALAAVLPLTGDEAYFALWGRYPALGYYDHPPLIGAILYPLRLMGGPVALLRLPPLLFSTLIGLCIHLTLRKRDPGKAALCAVFFLLSPLNLLNVLVSTDAPLMLFSFLSVLSLHTALRTEHPAWYALAGLCLGLAFLSKYFAVLLAPAYLLYFIRSPVTAARVRGFLLLVAAALPCALLNLYWNYTHAWANIMFNLINRNTGEQFSLLKPLAFAAFQLYFLTPPVVFHLIKKRAALKGLFRQDPESRLFLYAFLAPLALLALLSCGKMIGLHWMLSFYPFMYLLLFHFLTEKELRGSLRFMSGFAALHLAAIALVLVLPLSLLQGHKHYNAVVLSLYPQEVLERLRPYAEDFHWAAGSYVDAATLEYYGHRRVLVFGKGSLHARQDDLLTDFRGLREENILILRKSAPSLEEYAPFFRLLETEEIVLRGAAFWLVKGRGFNYDVYRDTVLTEIRERYYKIPPFLPLPADGGYFSKYFN